MNRNTGEGPGGNRGPLLLCFLCLHHPVEAGFCPARRLFCHVSGRAPVGAGVPDGPLYFLSARRVPRFRARVTFGRSGPLTFLFHASGGPISFSSERNGGKNAAKNQWFLEFLSSDHSHAAKRPTPNRSCPYPRCRFHVPQENAVSYRRGTVYLRVVRRSGSDKRTARDSLYDDVRQFKSRVVRGGGFQRTPAAQEVLKPAVSSSVFGHFWGCGQK